MALLGKTSSRKGACLRATHRQAKTLILKTGDGRTEVRRWCPLLRIPAKNIMSSDCTKNQFVFKKFKGEPIFHVNRSFPPVFCSLYSLCSKGRMGHVLQEKLQLLIKGFLNFFGQITIFFFKSPAELIGCYFFNHFNPSSAVLNFGETCPSLISSSTRASISCQTKQQTSMGSGFPYCRYWILSQKDFLACHFGKKQ